MRLLLATLLMVISSVCYSQITSVRTVLVDKEYVLSLRDQQSLLNITSNPTSVVKITVPFEAREIFRSGTKIYGNSLTIGTIQITPQKGVILINGDNAFRTKSLGSQWTLTKVKDNFWLLDGDLYSVEIESYIGDDVVIKAKVDSSASSPLTFTWYKNGSILQGKTQASLKMSNVQISDSGNYKVDVKNSKGYVSSEITSLLVR